MGAAEGDAVVGPVAGCAEQQFLAVTAKPVGLASLERHCGVKVEQRHPRRVEVVNLKRFHADAAHGGSESPQAWPGNSTFDVIPRQ